MNKDNVKNIIILKNLPSNLIDEAIMVVKDKKKMKNVDFSNSTYNKNTVIQGNMKEEEIRKIEKINKDDRKYVIKEAEFIISNYLTKIEKPFSDRRMQKLETKYKRIRILNFALGLTTFVSIIFAITM